jgi:hypothetical protein
MKLKSFAFSAFSPVTTKQLTVADIIAPIQSAVTQLNTVIDQRADSIGAAKAQVASLQQQVVTDTAEIASAKSVQEKLKNLLF